MLLKKSQLLAENIVLFQSTKQSSVSNHEQAGNGQFNPRENLIVSHLFFYMATRNIEEEVTSKRARENTESDLVPGC